MSFKGTIALVGLGMVGFGCWQISPPVAWVVVGGVLFAVAVVDAILEGRRR